MFLALAWLLSSHRKKINYRIVVMGILLQLGFATLVLKVPFVMDGFEHVAQGVNQLLSVADAGASFLFGDLVDPSRSWGYLFAFKVLPTIVFFSALMSLLYYLGVMQKLVYSFAWVMKRLMRLSGAESLAAAANIFVGQTEAPLMVKPYIGQMTRSEIMALMSGGMATIAGAVLLSYVGMLGGSWHALHPELTLDQASVNFTKHLLCASIISAPAALLFAKMLVPETQKVDDKMKISDEKLGSNVLDALSLGTTQGVKLAVNVGAMLLVFTAMMYGANMLLAWVGDITTLNAQIAELTNGKFSSLSFQFLLGYIMAPISWLMGVASTDITTVGMLLGEKTILNEFYAFASLSELIKEGGITNEQSIIIATYALCGFSNVASIGIQIGGISVLAPNKRTVLSQLGIRALVAGTLACFMTACIAGMLI